MNLINCDECGALFDKDILLKNLREQNKTVEYLARQSFADCPVCKDQHQFNFLDEVV